MKNVLTATSSSVTTFQVSMKLKQQGLLEFPLGPRVVRVFLQSTLI
jgi:hypothetical protein